MRYEDASQTGTTGNDVNARDDADHLASNDFGPATGNLITGAGTITGATGTDSSGHIVAIQGAGGSDNSIADGQLQIAGQYGTLTIDAEGNYSYVRNPGSPEGVSDTFTYTLADNAGATDTANLVISIGDIPMLQAQGNQTIQTNDGTVVLPAGVELSDVRVVGRDLVVTLPDGSTMVIPDGAIFVPQLVLDGVEVPASNLAALLIDAEPKPGAGDATPSQLSSGGNFALPPGPLDPGVPLGDLIPPTELTYTPPQFEEIGLLIEPNDPPTIGVSAINVSEEGVSTIAPPIPDTSGSPDTTNERIVHGTLPVSDPDGDVLTLTLGTPPSGLTSQGTLIVWTVSADGQTVTGTAGAAGPVVLTLHIDSVGAAGADYTVTLFRPVDHPTAGGEQGTGFVVPVTVSDGENPIVIGGAITVTIEDDSPVVSNVTVRGGVILDETDAGSPLGFPISGSTDGPVIVNSTGGFGADGAALANSQVFGLGLTGGGTSLSSGIVTAIGNFAITLVQIDSDTIQGQYTDGGMHIAFIVQMNADGSVTLTQNVPLEHNVDGPPGPAHDDSLSLSGLVNATVTLTDRDGDTASGSAPIGAGLVFKDDGPSVDGATINSSVTLDETNGAEPVSAGAAIVVTSVNPIIVGGSVDYGGDGKGPDPVFGLSLLGGGTSLASGLVTALGDHPITLELTSSTLITATYQDGGTHTAFTIAMNANGTITVTQLTALEHNVDGPPGPAHDDSLSLVTFVNEQAQSLVNATVTYQDSDGDTATASAGIGGAIIFKDDGPSVDITVGSDANILLVTDDNGTEGAGSTSASTTADFSGAFSLGASSGGGDGTAGITDISYNLTTAGGASGLTSHGNAINLYLVGTTVVGAVGALPADLTDPDIIFTVSVNGDGVVTLTQLQQIDHAPEASPVPGTGAPFSDQSTFILNDSLIQLHASATITDNDGDTATDNDAVLNIASNLVFRDDGPAVDASLKAGASLHVDESLPGTDGPGETDAVGLGQATVAISSLITVNDTPISADQPTTTANVLVLGAAVGGLVDSGMQTSLGDLHVYLYKQLDGSVIGSTALTAGAVDGTNTVFTVAISGGNVVLTQFQAIEHGDAPSNYDENTLGLAADALQLQVTITDFDGDTATDTVDLGSVITFGDDGPTVDVLEGQLPTDLQALAAFQLTTQDAGTQAAGFTTDSTTVNFSGLFSLSKDGGSDGEASSSLAFDLNLIGAGDGPVDSLLDSHGQTIWLYQLDANTIIGSTSAVAVGLNDASVVFQLITTNSGVVTLNQLQQIDHPIAGDPTPTGGPPFADHIVSLTGNLINLVATGTITDNDGDVATDVETIDLGGLVRFQDDGPTADNEGNLATVDDSATALNIGNVSTLLNGDNYGADGPAAVGAITIATGNQGGTITIDGSGNLLYTAAADASGGNVTETFTYTIKDFDGDTASATFTVTLTDSKAVIGTTAFSVDEEGLANGIAGTVYGDLSDLPGQSATASGNLTGLDFGSDGPGNIVLAASADTGLRTLSNQIVQSSWNAATHTLTGFVDLDANGLDAGDINVFTLTIDDVASGHYQFALLQPVKHATANTEDDVLLSVGVTVTDSETDGSSSTINITIDDDSPMLTNVAGGASVTLDETNAVPGGFPISATSATAVITATKAFGADGPAAAGDTVYGLTLQNGFTPGTTLASGLATAVGDFPITLNLVDATHITGTYNGANIAFTITMNAGGTITVQQNVPLEHLIDGSTAAAHNDALDLVTDGTLVNLINATITIKDGDGDTHSASTPIGDQITFLDDGPTINVTQTNEASIILTTQDADTIAAAFDTDVSTLNFSSVFGLSSTPGADGAASPSLSFDLNVLALDSGLKSHNVTINLYELANGVIVGSTALSAPLLETDASVVFSVAVAANGVVTLHQYQQIDHAVEGTPTAPFDDQFAILANGKINLVASSTITDNDGDTATDSETVDLGGNIRFADHGPSAVVNETGAGVSIDESAGAQTDSNDVVGPLTVFNTVNNKGVDPDMAAQFATNVNAIVNSTGTNLGADGAGSTLFSLTTSDPLNLGVDSGLNTTSGTNIFLFVEGAFVVGRVGATAGVAAGGPAAFALAIDATGHISMVQYLSLEHTNTGSKDESVMIADGALLAVVTATDFDGDVSAVSTPIGNLISFQDDAPVITAAQNMNINNGGDFANTALFTYDVGSDGPKPTNDEVKSVTFSAVVNSVTVQTTTPLTQVSEDADSAVFSFSFTYNTGGSSTATETGTITFWKSSAGGQTPGTYTVDLADPLAGISVQSVQGGQDPVFHDFGTVDNGIAVVEIASDFFIQFTGQEDVTTPSSDFGHNDLWGGGSQSEVKISSTEIGVFGNSVQDSDVLDYNFYATDPGGVVGPPTTSAGTAFITVAQFNGSEDFVVTLKLADPTHPGTGIIERTIVVDPADVLTVAPAGYPALGTNQGYIIIEPADYINLPGVPDNYQLVGLQLRSSNEGVSSTVGETYNFDGALGTSAFDTTAHAFDTANNTGTNDNDVFKIFDIGVLRTTTTGQTATLNFNVTIQDGDGDELSQALVATVTSAADGTTNIAVPASSSTVVPLALDTNADGSITFLDHSAGVTYDYNGDGVAEATAWVGGGDSILVRDANGDGTVTNASEFEFGHDGLTDMQALAAQYGEALDANDADFGQFKVWTDANSNGVADAGELTSLADAGITSIGLVSDGISYTAANGEVLVAGTGTYSMTDGSTGISADAAFATGSAAKTNQEVERVAANSNNIALAAAVAAAGVVATAPAAAAPAADDGGLHQAFVTNAVVGREAVSDLGDNSGGTFSALTALHDSGFDLGAQALATSSHMAISASHIGELASALSIGGAPNALLDATDLGGMLQMPAMSNGMSVAAPSLEALMPAIAGVQHGGAIEQILADALHGGGGPDINAMLNALPGGGLGAEAGLHGLATLATNGVSNGDMGHGAVFTFDVASIITSEAMVLHHDAVQPVANG